MPRIDSNRKEQESTSQRKDSDGTRDLTEGPVNILLLGTSGNGKSASGNSIIGKKVFQTSAGSSSVESYVVKNRRKWKEIDINVVDVPGVDTDNSSDEVLNKFKTFIDQAFEECPDGFSALVFVIKFGNRFVKQESEMIKLIRSTLGDGVIKNNVIFLLTHGDLFEEELNQDGNVNMFDSWCREQVGEIHRLFEECDYRCVLFNNRTKDNIIQSDQLKILMNCIKKTRTYGKKDFLSAESERRQAKLKNLASKVIQDTHEFLQKERFKMSEIESLRDVTKQIKELKTIINELKDYHEKISDTGCIFNKANNPTNYICALESEIESKIKLKELEKLQSTPYRVSDIQFNKAETAQHQNRSDSPELDDTPLNFSRDSKSRSMPIRKKSGRKAPRRQETAETVQSGEFKRGSKGRNSAPLNKMKNRPQQENHQETKQDKKKKKDCNIL